MCGIFVHIYRVSDKPLANVDIYTDSDKCSPLFSCSDSNCVNFLNRRGPDLTSSARIEVNGWWIDFTGYVLWTQGSKPTVQPILDVNGNILLWNGDLYLNKSVPDSECDSSTVIKHLSCDEDEINALTQLVGPFAFVFWNNKTKHLWFGRDVIGRHSLLWSTSPDDLILTSVARKVAKHVQELPSYGLCMIDFQQNICNLEINVFPWQNCLSELKYDLGISVNINKTIIHRVIGDGERYALWFEKEPENIDLEVYQKICSYSKIPSDIFVKCLENCEILSRVNKLIEILSLSVEIRVTKLPDKCKNCSYKQNCVHSKVGVLFSGGLDSTVLALLADKYVNRGEAIDLYNVAFQNYTKRTTDFNVPDRKTGLRSLEELQKLCPDRRWNFIKVDITQEDLESWRQYHISHLIHPLNTILDESLGSALWFAARGVGALVDGSPYDSSARVVLLGMGADEMLGGYMRHRTQFRRDCSWSNLAKSLAHDLNIIGQRNLGRDNRIVADHGRQPRLPFLDEHVVAFIQSLPPWHRCYLHDEMPTGVGDKLLLRLTAWKLGLVNASTYPKRAMQFGSRIANSSEKGNSVSQRL